MTQTSPSAAGADNYLDYMTPAASGGELSQLTALAEEQAKAESEVADLEAKLTTAREKVRDLSERKVPELMDQIGIEEFKTSSGLKIKVAETIRASISQAMAARAFAWLREHGHAAMIKRTVSVAFGKGEDEKAEELVKSLAERFECEDKTAVHPSTLSAFVREKLTQGDEIPLDLLGVHRQRVSKIAN